MWIDPGPSCNEAALLTAVLASVCVHAVGMLTPNTASNQMFKTTYGCSEISETHPLLYISWWLDK